MRLLRRLSGAAIVAGVVGLAILGGALAVISIQTAMALALLVLLLGLHSYSRRAGLIGLWTLWLLVPALRRLLALAEIGPSADPLALAPFVATGMLALLELQRARMSPAARMTLAIGALGFLIGAPMGLFEDPLAFAFGLTAYMAGLLGFVLGWSDRREGSRLTLVQVLGFVLPLIAVYGVLQYFLPLFAWDSNWLSSVDLVSIGAPEEGRIRIFSTLNSPGTLAPVLVLGILLGLGALRNVRIAVPTLTLLTVALALTFVRSAWLALVVGLLVYTVAARSRSVGKVVAVVAVCLVALLVVGGSNPTTQAFTQRITSLGDPGEDISAQARLRFTGELLPTAIGQPIGAGVGQAGLSVRLEDGQGNEGVETTDNGYLALIYQLGAVGFLLVTIAMFRGVLAAVRGVRASRPSERLVGASILAALVALLVVQAAGDMLYGVTGVAFWYLAGAAFANEARDSEDERAVRQASG